MYLIFSVGADEKLINQLSEDAKKKFDMAISLFTDILNQFVTGKIKIKLLNHILQESSSFFELLNLGKTHYMIFDTFTHYNVRSYDIVVFFQTVFVKCIHNTWTPKPWKGFSTVDERR